MSLTDELTIIEAAVARIRQLLPSEPEPTVVKAGDSLQAALDQGGLIALEAGATFEGHFTIGKPTILAGHGATLRGTTAPALTVLPGTHDVAIRELVGLSGGRVVFLLGHNDASQTALEGVPARVVVEDVSVPTHRGVRALEVNSTATVIRRFRATDCWGTGLESKGINVLNTPGDVLIEDCHLEVGSIGILVGGDTSKLPTQTEPEGIIIRRTNVIRPLAWRTDGISRTVKTSIEFKGGRRCLVEDCRIDGCWKDGQDGYGGTITPRNGAQIADVTWRNVHMRSVTGGFNVTGQDTATKTPAPTTGLRIQGGSVVTNKGQLGGRGTFMQLSSGPIGSIEITGATILPEHSVVYHGERTPIAEFVMHDCLMLAGSYGFTFGAVAHGSDLTPVTLLDISGNVIGGASAALAKVLKLNTHEPKTVFLARPEIQAVLV